MKNRNTAPGLKACTLHRVMFKKLITCTALAKSVGVSGAYISQVASGQRVPALPVALRISAVVDWPVAQLWEFEQGVEILEKAPETESFLPAD